TKKPRSSTRETPTRSGPLMGYGPSTWWDRLMRKSERPNVTMIAYSSRSAPAPITRVERPHQQPLHEQGDDGAQHHRRHDRGHLRHPGPEHEQRVGVRADHEELAVGEVDDLQDAEDQREPERHERVERAHEEAGEEDLEDQHAEASAAGVGDGSRWR